MTVGDLFKDLCARQGKPYDADITRRAIEAALHARDKARQDLMRVIRPAASEAMLRPPTSSPDTWRPWKTRGTGRPS